METDQPYVTAFMLLNPEGKRLYARYYSGGGGAFADKASRSAFEEQVYRKTFASASVRAAAAAAAAAAATTTGGDGGVTLSGNGALGAGGNNHLDAFGAGGGVGGASDIDVLALGSHTVLYKACADIVFYVVTSASDNELAVAQVLSTAYEVLLHLLNEVHELSVLEHYELLLLVLDEIIDDEGVILETDALEVASRMEPALPRQAVNLSEQSLGEALNTATQHLTRSLMK